MPQNLSIVVPAYNVEAYLLECLASLADRDDVGEVVVVDDGSTDGTLALARAFAASQPRVTVLSEEHRGLSATRNTGVAAAQGEFLAFCDADDRVPPGAYDHLLRALGASGSDLGSLLAVAWRPERHLSLTLKVGCLGIEAANDHHVPIELSKLSLSEVFDEW